jgi:AraC-like DNA-binding protein
MGEVNAATMLTFSTLSEGAACGLFLMLACVLWRDRSTSPTRGLSVALASAAAAGAIGIGLDVRPQSAAWQLPVLILWGGSPALFLLWARSAFDDEFVLRPWHALLWLAFVGCRLIISYPGMVPTMLVWTVGTAYPYMMLVIVLLAAAQTLVTWRSDLIARRRKLRGTVLAATVIYSAADTLSDLAYRSVPAAASYRITVEAAGLFALALFAGWKLLRIADDADGMFATRANIGLPDGEMKSPAALENGKKAADPALLRRLDRLMVEERVYRREGLTIGALAAKLGVQEYRLRQAINEGLGYRNFNAFLNSYRLGEAKAALADPEQEEVPILTIAMDAGFRSLGPFNRAFKADTGTTPTEFRRNVLSRLSNGPVPERAEAGVEKSR